MRTMNRLIISLISSFLIAGVHSASANSISDWMGEHRNAQASVSSHDDQPADAAQLLTLEPGQTEMYARPSPDGRFLITLNSKRNTSWISRHFSENGDPANRISDDNRAFDSIGWRDNTHVYYLSERAGGLALWEKISDGEGMQRRIQALHGMITQPILLENNTIIAVRLTPLERRNKQHQNTHSRHKADDNFNNWTFDGFRTDIVRFNADGEEQVLANGVNPSISPDGQWLAFSMQTGRSMHLFRISLDDSSELIQITDSRSVDVQPSWSKDSQRLYFTSNRARPDLRHANKSQWDIWSIDINGRNLTQLTHNEARDGAARMDKNGKIYFHSDRKIAKALRAQHQLGSGSNSGFHIWTIDAPKPVK